MVLLVSKLYIVNFKKGEIMENETIPTCHECGVNVFPEDDNICDKCLELSHVGEE